MDSSFLEGRRESYINKFLAFIYIQQELVSHKTRKQADTHISAPRKSQAWSIQGSSVSLVLFISNDAIDKVYVSLATNMSASRR